jgi:hypothetical protein
LSDNSRFGPARIRDQPANTMTTANPTIRIRALAAAASLAVLVLLAPAVRAQARVALLIGNNAYPTSPLRNAVNDSRDLGATLGELGFKTIIKENASRAQMIAALQEFGKALEGAEAAVFFYAGHAMQFKDRNYLIPIDAVMGSEDDVTFFSVDVTQVFDRMERARTKFNFVILDACRDNPFKDTFKVSATGLAQMSGPSGTLIAYATAPGATAQDGFGRNGVYTGHILQNIKIPDMPVEVLFRKVREGVERDTKRLQTPWELSSIKGDFVFNATGRPAASGGTVAGGQSADVAAQYELQFWKSVSDSNRADDIQAYLDKYPSGVFAPLAKNRIDSLLGRNRVATAVASVQQKPAPSSSPEPAPAAPVSTTTASGAARETPGATAPAAGAAPPPRESAPPPATRPAAEAVAEPKGPVLAVAAPTGSAPSTPQASSKAAEAAAPAPQKPVDDLPGREIAPGVRELTFADGSIYRGAVRGLRLHGQGEYVSKSFKYVGEFKDGLKHGAGSYTWDNGDHYEGTFVEDRPDGKGKYRFANGDSYEGDVKAGVVSGRGIYITKSGDRIEGSFTDGKPNGTGIYRFASGDRYEGEMSYGKLQGKGRYFTSSGDRIEGQFADGKPQGKGAYFFSNGDRYEGDLQGGALTGTGAYFYASGPKYEGEVANGRPQGKGTFWFADGSRFEGVFENGLAKAKGSMIRTDGTRRAAEIVEGAVHLLD